MTELSRDIVGYRLQGQVTALFLGRRRRASPAVCLRWLPVWLPRNLISFANRLIRHVADWSGEAVVRSSTGPASPATGHVRAAARRGYGTSLHGQSPASIAAGSRVTATSASTLSLPTSPLLSLYFKLSKLSEI